MALVESRNWDTYNKICEIVSILNVCENDEWISDAYVQDETLFVELQGRHHIEAHNLDIKYSYWWNCPARYMFLTVEALESLKEV